MSETAKFLKGTLLFKNHMCLLLFYFYLKDEKAEVREEVTFPSSLSWQIRFKSGSVSLRNSHYRDKHRLFH